MKFEYDFEESVGYWVTITAISFRRALNEELAPVGITHRQFQVLGWLVLEGKLTQSELACRMDIEPPTLAGIIDRMESAGWVRRAACENDRRRKFIHMEPAAEPVWEQIAASARLIRTAATAGFTDEEANQMRSLLRRMHENLSRFEIKSACDAELSNSQFEANSRAATVVCETSRDPEHPPVKS